ncbi:hypothetical protein KUTeg_008140 [Tegillarca granosa]|uniref:VWFD domain-containing protein n=1 Tax=Tegillarca granosa TaxID=220873 RepID=A0ABQ9F898_TEGGR|nr:hypothetical protein KUTeg_008140 [Tegillarca granosa]
MNVLITCTNSKWICDTKECPAVCSAYGDSHYHTFDGKSYDFQGDCSYVLAQSTDDNAHPFQITTENVPCGSSGVTCAKSIEFSIGNPGKPVNVDSGSPFNVTEVGDFVIVKTPSGITLTWDKGTRVYIKLSTEHKGKSALVGPDIGLTGQPTAGPNPSGTGNPTPGPNAGGTGLPTAGPNAGGTGQPTAGPNAGGTGLPTAGPNAGGTGLPTAGPNAGGVGLPTAGPNAGGTGLPTAGPNAGGTGLPTAGPNAGGTGLPTAGPNAGGTGLPTAGPNAGGTGLPTAGPNAGGTGLPTAGPNAGGTGLPTAGPNAGGTAQPTAGPNAGETGMPTPGSQHQCNHGWTQPMNVDSPYEGEGDLETLAELQSQPYPTNGPHPNQATTGSVMMTTLSIGDQVCDKEVGMYDPQMISSDQLTASTSTGAANDADKARINGTSAWVSRYNDDTQYIQVDLRHSVKVAGVEVQGNPNQPQWDLMKTEKNI